MASNAAKKVRTDGGASLVGTFRRLGPYGPVYEVVRVHGNGANRVVDIEVPESGEKTSLPLAHVLASPKAD